MCLNIFKNFIRKKLQVNINNMYDELVVTLTLRNEKLKTRKYKRKRSVWVKSWLSNRIKTSAYQNIFTELWLMITLNSSILPFVSR